MPLAPLRCVASEVDSMPSDYVILLSGGIPVGKRQESKTTVSEIGAHVSIRVLDAKTVANVNNVTGQEWTMLVPHHATPHRTAPHLTQPHDTIETCHVI